MAKAPEERPNDGELNGGVLLFLYEGGTAVWPREFYHGNLLLKQKVVTFPWPYRGSYFVKKTKTPSFDSPWFGLT